MLAVADAAAAVLASSSLAWAFGGAIDQALWAAAFVPGWVLLAKLLGLYDLDHRSLRHLTVDELPSLVLWATAGTASLALFLVLMPAPTLGARAALQVALIAAGAAAILRGVARWSWRYVTARESALIIGNGALADATARKLQLFSDIHVNVVTQRDEVGLTDLESMARAVPQVDRIIVASQEIDEDLVAELVAFCRREQIKLSVVPPLRGMFVASVQLNRIAELPVFEYSTWDVPRSTMLLKRMLDIAMSSVALVVLAPLFALIAFAIKLDSRGPVLFAQRRAGLGGRPFRMYKFRTMVSDAEERLHEVVVLADLEEPMFKLTRDPRVTRVGRVLRRASLDELPQLFNVLMGEMSLVGPRPEQVELVERYRPEHLFKLEVKPGITGPMQVYGRGELRFEERLAVEREYVENLSIGRDLRILALTTGAVFNGKGAF
jgi:exopolysaccharide biosynthesis polyprenyl glycosylphosphotransferase